jgi:hypothetical protein
LRLQAIGVQIRSIGGTERLADQALELDLVLDRNAGVVGARDLWFSRRASAIAPRRIAHWRRPTAW